MIKNQKPEETSILLGFLRLLCDGVYENQGRFLASSMISGSFSMILM